MASEPSQFPPDREPEANPGPGPGASPTRPSEAIQPPLPLYPPVEDVLERIDPPLSLEHEKYVRIAYSAAQAAHDGQVRMSGEPYFSHCIEVALLLAERVTDWATIAAGLLHDTIEDCDFTSERIEGLLPDPVAELVESVTKISKLNFSSDREHQAGNLRKMILAMARDVRVVIIKLCDRLHNMRTLQYLPPEKQKAIATTTMEILAPLANRLGMEEISNELEDLSLKYLNPVFYRQLDGHLQRNGARYDEVIRRMRTDFVKALGEEGIEARVTGRVKHINSIYKKMLSQGLTFTEIHDLIAIRVVTKNVDEAYKAFGLVHRHWKPVPGKFKDYIASPKPNGYQSIHTTVMGPDGEIIEMQIRTEEMHSVAAEGIASHWNYKEDRSGQSPKKIEAERMAWLRQLIDTLSDIRDPQEFMAALKHDVFDDSVFCHTPGGEVIEMRRGSTVLDFAYRIHTDIGSHCHGAKVNHKMAPLRTVLKTGDIIEIQTSNSAHPTRDWLQIVKTGRAGNKIRHWLKANDREFYQDRGRNSLAQELKARGLELPESRAAKLLDMVASQLSYSNGGDLLSEIGFGTVKAGTVITRMDLEDKPARPPERKRASKRERQAEKPSQILIEGMPGALTRIAKCCEPQPGDAIAGFITQGRGISVHKPACPQLKRLRNQHVDTPNRMVSVEWGGSATRSLKASVRCVCQDRQGLLMDITSAITDMGIAITDVETHSNLKTHRAILKFIVLVPDEGTLDSLLKRLETVPSLLTLSRKVIKSGRSLPMAKDKKSKPGKSSGQNKSAEPTRPTKDGRPARKRRKPRPDSADEQQK